MIRIPVFLLPQSAENVCQEGNYGQTCSSSVFEPTSGQGTLCLGDICGGGNSSPKPPKPTPKPERKTNRKPKPPETPTRSEDPPTKKPEPETKPQDPPNEDPPPPPNQPPPPPPPVTGAPPPPWPPPPGGTPPPVIPPGTPAPTGSGISIDIDFGKFFAALGKVISVGGAFNGEVAWGAYNAPGTIRLAGFARGGAGHVFTPKNWLLSAHCSYTAFFFQRFGEEKTDPRTGKSAPDTTFNFSHGFLCGGGIGRRFKSQFFLAHIEGGGVFRQSTPDFPEDRAAAYKAGLLYSPFGGRFYLDMSALFFTNKLNSTDASKPDPSILFGIQWIQ